MGCWASLYHTALPGAHKIFQSFFTHDVHVNWNWIFVTFLLWVADISELSLCSIFIGGVSRKKLYERRLYGVSHKKRALDMSTATVCNEQLSQRSQFTLPRQLQHTEWQNIVTRHTWHEFRCWFPTHRKWKYLSGALASNYTPTVDRVTVGCQKTVPAASMHTAFLRNWFHIGWKTRFKNFKFQVPVQQQRQIYLITAKIHSSDSL